MNEIEAYLIKAARARNINPNSVVRLARAEGGLTNPIQQSYAQAPYGREESYGALQLHMRGGLGAKALKAGIDPRKLSDWKRGIDFALDEAVKAKNWRAWAGRHNAGIGDYGGLENARPAVPYTGPSHPRAAGDLDLPSTEQPSENVQIASADPNYWGPGYEPQERPKSALSKVSATLGEGYEQLAQNQGSPAEQLQPLTSGGSTGPAYRTIPLETPEILKTYPTPDISPAVKEVLKFIWQGRPMEPGQAPAMDFFSGGPPMPVKAAKYLYESAKNMFTRRDAQQPNAPVAAPGDVTTEQLFGGGAGGAGGAGAGGAGGNRTFTIDIGKQYQPPPPPLIKPLRDEETYPTPPPYVDPPDRPHIEEQNWEPFLDKMKRYEPQDIDKRQYMKDRFLSNLSRAFAAGAGGSGWSGAGGAIARFGSGVGLGTANTMEEYLGKQEGIDEGQRQFGMDMLNMRMKMEQANQQVRQQNAGIDWQNRSDEYTGQQNAAQRDFEYNVGLVNNAIEVGNRNAATMYEYNNQIGAAAAPKVEATSKDSIIIRKTDRDTGNTQFEVHRFDDPLGGVGGLSSETYDLLNKVQTYWGKDSPQARQLKYSQLFQQRNEFEVKRMMAAEAVESGSLDMLLPGQGERIHQEAEEALNSQGHRDGETGWPELLAQSIATRAAAELQLTDTEMLKRAAQMGNVGATMLLSNYLRLTQEQQPVQSIPAPTYGPR